MLNLGSLAVDALALGSSSVRRCYLGADMVWDKPLFVDEPKIDPAHPLANVPSTLRLESGQLQGMTGDANVTIVDDAYASATAGTVAFAKEASFSPLPNTFRVSALIKADKTAGRYSRIGWTPNNANPTASSTDVYVGHDAGSGIRMNGLGLSLGKVLIEEAKVVDGAWYRVTLAWDSVLHQNTATDNTGRNRVSATAEPVDPVNTPAVPWYPQPDTKTATTMVPMALTAKTNSANGTIRDLRYTASMLGANSDNAPILTQPAMSATTGDTAWVFSKGKAAPPRIIITAGGSGVYGAGAFAFGNGRTGHPYDAWRALWRELADLGYTVLHTNALHEGWGADDHLAKQLQALNLFKTEFGADARLYYLGYSMGGISAWRAIMGRAGFPALRAAYLVAGAAHLDMYYDIPGYAAIKTRWPDRGALDEPINFSGADLVARGTRVRMVTSTGDTNVSKTVSHDPMVAKYTGTPGGSALISELVHSGITHFDPSYWNASDIVGFFEGADL